jgi:cobalt/nickel transport system permease protein
MHLGNGAITPECVALTAGAATLGLATSAVAVRRAGLSWDRLQMAGVLGGLVFAAQAINLPIVPGMSAHLVGGVLLAWILGPALGSLTMAAILAIQATALGDGGISALGANALNMAILPACIVITARRIAPSSELSSRSLATVAIAACVAVPLAAFLIVAETALFRQVAELTHWTSFAAIMLSTHAWFGVFESVLTAALVSALAPLTSAAGLRPAWRPAVMALAAGLLLAALLLPISSAFPDGYEAAAQASGIAWLLAP